VATFSFRNSDRQLRRRQRRPQHDGQRRNHRRPQVEQLESRELLDSGTWAQLATLAPTQIGTMHLLTDGTVLAQGDLPGVNSITDRWYKLKPDASGSYQNGSWSQLASMHFTRLYFGSNVLPNGDLFVQGGEYSSQGSDTRTGETYDPLTNTWTNHANFVNGSFGDDPTMLLPTGKILGGYINDPQTYLYNPATDSWAATGTKLRNDKSDEETFVLLPPSSAHSQGAVLSYDVWASISAGVNHAQIYDIASGTWSDTPFPSTFQTPLLSSSGIGFENGPALLLPDGRVFQIGALAHTALYDTNTGTWSRGPDIPGNYGSDDAPAAILPDGHVIFLADAGPFRGTFSPPSHMFDFDPTNDSITDITSTLPSALQTQLAGQSAYQARLLMLPSGQLLLAPDNQGGGGNRLYIFTPSNGPDPSWQPTVASVTDNGGGAYTLTGTQINGISAGSSYGDDAESDSNYPIVQLTNLTTGVVSYARTTGWTPGVSAVGDSTIQSVNFQMPSGAPVGVYSLVVSGAGIASDPYAFFASTGGPGAEDPGDSLGGGADGDGGNGGPTPGAARITVSPPVGGAGTDTGTRVADVAAFLGQNQAAGSTGVTDSTTIITQGSNTSDALGSNPALLSSNQNAGSTDAAVGGLIVSADNGLGALFAANPFGQTEQEDVSQLLT
jgi:hypothetical protein